MATSLRCGHLEGLNIVGFMKADREKPINAGVYVVSPEALSEVDQSERMDMPTFFESTVKWKKNSGVPMHEPWFDVGRPSDLKIPPMKI